MCIHEASEIFSSQFIFVLIFIEFNRITEMIGSAGIVQCESYQMTHGKSPKPQDWLEVPLVELQAYLCVHQEKRT